MEPPAGLDAYEVGMRRYRLGQFEAAQEFFEQATAAGLNDFLTEIFLKRSRELQVQPPEKWQGVYTMTSK
jgi:adenylate cyclase